MPKTKISEFSATPGNNTDIDGINIAEGCAPSGINDAIRELMAQLKDFQAGTAGDSFNGPVGTTTAAAGAFTTLSASSTVSGTGFSNYLASPPAIGGTAAAAGSFTTLTTSSTVTHNGGTANGVAYLNGSKVLTTGSALTFDGSTLYNSGNISVGGNSGGNRYVALLNETNTYTGTLMLQAGGGSAAYGGAVVMYGHSHASYPGAVYVGSSSGAGTGIIFGGGGNAGPATSEWMRLTSTGLGIGTSSPATKLDVVGAIRAVTASTAANNLRVGNTGNSLFLGVDSSTGGTNIVGSVAYATTLATNTALQISTNNGASVQATLDSSGNLGIGVTSPTRLLHLGGGAGVTVLQMSNNASGNTVNDGLQIIQSGVDSSIVNKEAGYLSFETSNTERARITSGGELLVGATAAIASEKFYVNGSNASYITRTYNSNASPYGAIISYTGAAPNGTANEFLRCDDTAAARMSVRSNGGIANYQANDVNLSDQRLKTDVQPAGTYLDKICAIPVKTFLYKDQTDTERNLGVMAQDVDAVAPELIDHSGFGEAPEGESPYLAVYQTDLQYALMKCIQELKAQNDDLRARVAQLEAK